MDDPSHFEGWEVEGDPSRLVFSESPYQTNLQNPLFIFFRFIPAVATLFRTREALSKYDKKTPHLH